jgi:Ferritin-like
MFSRHRESEASESKADKGDHGVANTKMELMAAPVDSRDLSWLRESLQAALELEFATLPIYLSGMWSIKNQSGEVYDLINSVVLEEMLHTGFACNMLKAIGGTPEIVAPTYPGHVPGLLSRRPGSPGRLSGRAGVEKL